MITNRYFFGFLCFFLLSGITGMAQKEIKLMNSSFEIPNLVPFGNHACCKAPRGWFPCGGPDSNTPDVQPGHFGVDLAAAEGNYYLGMVTRDNDSWESVSQRLPSAMEAGSCYTFSLKISYADRLRSQSRRLDVPALYNNPVKVRLWGGSGYCHTAELLDETDLINHTNWKQYNFRFEPTRRHTFFTIEVFYKTPTPVPYNGNVLIDDASSILLVPCSEEDEPPIVDVKQSDIPVNIAPSNPIPEPDPTVIEDPVVYNPPTKTDPPAKTKPPEKTLPPSSGNEILQLDPEKIVAGQVIRIENLYFKADSTNISEDGFPVLDEIYHFLRSNKGITIEIGGHTNNKCETVFCDKLSEKRAKSVANYLRGKGIKEERLLFKGYGKRDPVATNTTRRGREKNQRVEIKILTLNG